MKILDDTTEFEATDEACHDCRQRGPRCPVARKLANYLGSALTVRACSQFLLAKPRPTAARRGGA